MFPSWTWSEFFVTFTLGGIVAYIIVGVALGRTWLGRLEKYGFWYGLVVGEAFQLTFIAVRIAAFSPYWERSISALLYWPLMLGVAWLVQDRRR